MICVIIKINKPTHFALKCGSKLHFVFSGTSAHSFLNANKMRLYKCVNESVWSIRPELYFVMWKNVILEQCKLPPIWYENVAAMQCKN